MGKKGIEDSKNSTLKSEKTTKTDKVKQASHIKQTK